MTDQAKLAEVAELTERPLNPAHDISSKPSKGKGSKLAPQKAARLTSSQLAQLKSLYLVKSAGPSEIADKLGITPKHAQQWIYRLGLAKKREVLAARLEEKELAKAQSDIERAMDSFKAQSEEVAEDVFRLSREEIEGKSAYKAKNLAAYSMAAKNFIGIYRDSSGINNTTAPSVNVLANFYLGNIPEVKAEPPAVDV